MKIFCEKYRCRMQAAACIRRQEIVNSTWVQKARLIKKKIAIEDPGCKDCEQGKEIVEMVKKAAAEKPTERGVSMVLDFSDYPEIIEELKSMARDEFRSVEMQTMYMVVSHITGRLQCKQA